VRKFQENFLENSIRYSAEDTVSACKEAHQGGSALIVCNLKCLVSDLRQKGYDKKTLDELDKFVVKESERFTITTKKKSG